MVRRLFAPRAGVIVDVCSHHGVWLDANELEQLIAFTQHRGLDRRDATPDFRPTAVRPPTAESDAVSGAGANRRARASTSRDARFFENAIDAFTRLLG